ncbi:MAG TPA: rod shape-determining protein MreC [Clostridia bacterium]|nr:rod shape-determining protein MreC [Clostridia bacterium]
MPRFLKNTSLVVFIVIVVLLIALMIYTEAGRERASLLENTLGQVLAPVQKGLYTLSTYVHNIFAGIGERRNIIKEHGELKEKVIQLENDLSELMELEKQNERLKELAMFRDDNKEIIVTGAKVIAKNPGNWFNNITIDRGERHGVSVNMAIVTNEGLVGRVIEVANDWSKIRTIVDGKSAVSGIAQRNRDNGLLKGNNSLGSEDGMCRMIYLPEDSNIAVGDKILTSGLGEIFPKGIYIGEVEKVIKDKRDLYKTAIVRPGVDFQRLEEVLVVTSDKQGIFEE